MCRWPAARKRASLSAEGRLRGRGSCCKVLAAWQLCRLGFLLTLARGLLPGSFYNLESQAPSERPESLLASPCAGSMLALLLFSWLAVSSSRCGSGRGCFRLITLPLFRKGPSLSCTYAEGARGQGGYLHMHQKGFHSMHSTSFSRTVGLSSVLVVPVNQLLCYLSLAASSAANKLPRMNTCL